MHRPKNSMFSSSETYGFASTSNAAPLMNEHEPLPIPLGLQSFSGQAGSSFEPPMFDRNTDGPQSANPELWNSEGSSTMDLSMAVGTQNAVKAEHSWPSSGFRRRRAEGTSSAAFEGFNLDLNLSQLEQEESLFDAPNLELNAMDIALNCQYQQQEQAQCTQSNNVMDVSPLLPSSSNSSPAASGSLSQIPDILTGPCRTQQASVSDSNRLRGKRKIVDGVLDHSSASGSSSNQHQIGNIFPAANRASPNLNLPGVPDNAAHVPTLRWTHGSRAVREPSGCYRHHDFGNYPQSYECYANSSSRVNFDLEDSGLSNTIGEDGILSSSYNQIINLQSSASITARQTAEPISLTNTASPPPFARHARSLRSSSHPRVLLLGGSSVSPGIAEDLIFTGESSSMFSRNSAVEPAVFAPAVTSNPVVPDAANRQLFGSTGSRHPRIDHGNRQLRGPNVVPSHLNSALNERNLSSNVWRIPPLPAIQIYGNSRVPSQNMMRNNQPGVALRGHHTTNPHAAASDGWFDLSSELPSYARGTAAVRDGQSRMLSEIRDIIHSLHQDRPSRFEDFRSVILARANLHDRHRDMRLDVDNMSYEELLALEERIGNVSTGLSEEKITSCLKQWKFASSTAQEPAPVVEPCCICQEEYAAGEDMGSLGCGHDFHTDCIKQWLAFKNLCPVCKKAALET